MSPAHGKAARAVIETDAHARKPATQLPITSAWRRPAAEPCLPVSGIARPRVAPARATSEVEPRVYVPSRPSDTAKRLRGHRPRGLCRHRDRRLGTGGAERVRTHIAVNHSKCAVGQEPDLAAVSNTAVHRKTDGRLKVRRGCRRCGGRGCRRPRRPCGARDAEIDHALTRRSSGTTRAPVVALVRQRAVGTHRRRPHAPSGGERRRCDRHLR
jgi:hypothetical protein